jgi:hypothetical protein
MVGGLPRHDHFKRVKVTFTPTRAEYGCTRPGHGRCETKVTVIQLEVDSDLAQ